MTTPIYGKEASSYSEAVKYHKQLVRQAADDGWAIRRSWVVSEKDFETGKRVWRAMVRVSPLMDQDLDVSVVKMDAFREKYEDQLIRLFPIDARK